MHMMFADESGDPGYPADGNWNEFGGSRYFARVGIILHGWKWKTWHERMTLFKKKNGLIWSDEIKASHIRRGKNAFIGWDEKRRKQFMFDLLGIIGGTLDITMIGVAIDKQKVDTTKNERIINPAIRSLEFLLERYNSFLGNQKDKCGIVILDPVERLSDDNHRHFQSYLLEHSSHLKPSHIVEGTFFAKAHTSCLIQVADICTNVFYRYTCSPRQNKQEFDLVNPRFWRHNSKLKGYGIKIWPDK